MLTLQSSHLELQTKLSRVETRSKMDPSTVFNNLGHIIDLELLKECFRRLKGSKSTGVDRITKEDYGKNLDENTKQLLVSIRQLSYRPKPSQITHIPKENGETRPIAVSCVADKLVQSAVQRILQSIYEPLFSNSSFGGRPGRSAHSALSTLDRNLMNLKMNAVLEIDFKDFFGTIPHEIMLNILKLKISDSKFLRLIIRLLKTPTLDADGRIVSNQRGLPQGSILSPCLSNVFLDHVLDQWFEEIKREKNMESAAMVRYLDDAVFTFESMGQARLFLALLKARILKFGIQLNEEKTRILPGGRLQTSIHEKEGKSMPTFSFLGFLHVWGKGWSKKKQKHFYRVKRLTDPIRFRKKLKAAKEYIAKNRHAKDLLPKVKLGVIGFLNYFAISDNRRRCDMFVEEVYRFLYKYLNRRSQKKSISYEKLNPILKEMGYPFKFKTKNILNSFV